MTEPATTIETNAVRSPLWQRAAFFVLRWTYRIVGGLMIAIACVLLLAQTDYAQSWIRTRIIGFVNDQLAGTITCDNVQLDIFRGIVLEHPKLYAHGSAVLEADRLSITYDLAAAFGNTIAINNITLTKPKVYIIRGKDSVWNVSRIAKPSTDTNTSSLPNLTIRLRRLVVTEGKIVVNDRTVPWGDGTTFDPTHLSLMAFELRASARLALADGDHSIGIDHLSFYDRFAPTLDVREITASARVHPSGLDVHSFSLRMAHTDVSLNAALFGANMLVDGLTDSLLALHPIAAEVRADTLWGPDIGYFVPGVDIVGSYRFTARAVFYGDELAVDNIDLRAGPTRVFGNLKVRGVSGKEKLGIEVRAWNSTAQYADVRRRLRFVPLPELPFLTTTSIESFHLKGHPTDALWIDVHAQDRPARFDGQMKLFLASKRLGYDVDMKIAHGDISAFSDSSVTSDLYGHVVLHGKGVTLQDIEGSYRLSLDRSVIAGRQLRRATVHVVANGAGRITIDTVFVDLTPFRKDTIDEYALTPDARLVRATGVVNVADRNRPTYSGHLSVSALDLSALLNSPSLPTRLSGSFDVDAEGAELDSILGTGTARIEEFALADRALLPFTLKLASTRNGAVRTFLAEAPFVHARIEGRYLPSTLISAISASVFNTIDAVKDRIRHLYTSSGQVEHMGTALLPTQATFDVDLRDASVLNIFLSDITFSSRAMIRGSIRAFSDSLVTDIDTLRVSDLLMKADSLNISSDPLELSLVSRLSSISTSPRVAELRIKGRCDSNLIVNDVRIHKPVVDFLTKADTLLATARANVNGIETGAKFKAQFSEDSTYLTFDSVHVLVDAERGLDWRLLDTASLTLRNAAVTIFALRLQRVSSEIISAKGRLSADEFDSLALHIENFELANIPKFVPLGAGHPVRLLSGMVRSLEMKIHGRWEDPTLTLKMNAVGVYYNYEPIGSLNAVMSYSAQDVTGYLTISNPALTTDTKTLTVQVAHLPLDLGLRNVKQRFVDGRPIDIALKANKVALATVEPFLPAIERLRGVADAEITIKGSTPDKVALGGNARFNNASFLSSATNVLYRADAVLHLDGSHLHLDTVIIRNVERDRKSGFAYANGVVEFDGLSVQSIDFNIRTPGLLVMNKSSQARSPKIFGDVVIASGSEPIHFYGKLDAPVLEGDIYVLYADVIFPQERSTTKSRYTAFEYNRTTDTNRRYNSVFEKANKVRLTSDSSSLKHPVAEAIEYVVKSTTASFADLLRFDLNIYLKGRTLMTMVFGTFEILIADLEQVDQKLPLVFTGRFLDNSTNLRGKVRVKEGTSTYKFYKPFLASGTLDFVQGGMTNPALDLKAVYRDRRTLANGNSEDFRVEILITGTKLKPITKWAVYRQDRKQEGDSAKITGDALMLILVGKTQDELVSSGQGNLVGEVNASFSALATSALGDLLSGIGGVVQSAQIDVGSDVSQSRLTVSGQLFSDVTYRLSGQISDFSGNSTITVSVPFTVLSDVEAMRYFMLDVSRSVNSTGNITRYQRLWEIKLGARLP